MQTSSLYRVYRHMRLLGRTPAHALRDARQYLAEPEGSILRALLLGYRRLA